ncbi:MULTISPECIES: hypothetical protein [unclassified Streptomyces]|uniref:hypothetical protein n=1 Tax=unclassified Streptomyces TaxID=2593676 RepID=UPI00365326EA
MKRMGLTAAGFAVAVTAMTGLGAFPASAAEQARPAERPSVSERATVSERASAADRSALSGRYPHLRGKYWTRGGCLEAGQEGINRGHWTGYECANGTLQWVLWTD